MKTARRTKEGILIMKKIIIYIGKKIMDIRWVIIAFVFLSLIYLELPGLYFDAVNPDYMGLHAYHPDNVSEWAYSDNIIATLIEGGEEYSRFPVLNSLYGTCFEAYTMMLWAIPFGYGVFGIRTSHILYAVLLLLGVYFLLKYVLENKKQAALGTFFLAIEPSLMFSTRTQFYIQLFPYVFFSVGMLLIIKSIIDDKKSKRNVAIGSILLGLASCSYFVFAFYFAGIFISYIVILHKKREEHRYKKIVKMIVGFLVGYFPYLYAHISIVLTQGIDGWITALKGLNAYGISDGANASIIERIMHIINRISSIVGGSSIIEIMTGKNMGLLWGRLFAVLYVCCFIIAIVVLIKKRNEIRDSRLLIALYMLVNIFVFHCFFAMIVGNALGYQHFIMLMPIMYITMFIVAIVAYRERKREKEREKERCASKIIGQSFWWLIAVVIMTVSIFKVCEGYYLIKKTGGYSYYSEVINDMAYYLEGTVMDNDIIVSPQWGYWMQTACITGGNKQIWADADCDVLQRRIDATDKNGKYYVIVDNKTDRDMILNLMRSNGYVKEYQIEFNDYGFVLCPEIWIYSKE